MNLLVPEVAPQKTLNPRLYCFLPTYDHDVFQRFHLKCTGPCPGLDTFFPPGQSPDRTSQKSFDDGLRQFQCRNPARSLWLLARFLKDARLPFSLLESISRRW